MFAARFFGLLIGAVACLASSGFDVRAERIVIAARADVRPFIWQDDTGDNLGFFWSICIEAAKRAGYDADPRTITTAQRDDFLDGKSKVYDLLCDPTTITLGRMKNFLNAGSAPWLTFSQIIFVASGAFVNQTLDIKGPGWGVINDKKGARCDALRDAKPTNEGVILRPPESATFEIWGFLKGSTIGAQLQAEISAFGSDPRLPLICTREFDTHREAAEAFCERRIARYFGDADIIRATIAAYNEKPGHKCSSQAGATFNGSYEPYAFVTSSFHSPEFPKRFSFELYEMFVDGTIERLFAGHFPNSRKSDPLKVLFQINTIPRGVDQPAASTTNTVSSATK
ncbi:substrate-binding periplasmic protein [Rhizobium leguminosarum]|uniref:substrate-binding periplasmic protein n=1 Tax=Rhizobium leguminosarum TaxID=384 RepID=UPI001C9459CB|nr:transporter substrate-binding domain-containing protein [Rhizobium leguminosarum]MBY5560803.1 amino acid ABC transporter substrate-binding protein [Rhizobium leguminosarum]MBY5714399.1 amino acid ABC transporter substrate-binding protein [Rhizobium leguminosarum]